MFKGRYMINDWIEVKEKLPDVMVEVLVYTDYKSFFIVELWGWEMVTDDEKIPIWRTTKGNPKWNIQGVIKWQYLRG
jgi:hypothetical protein